MKRYQVVFLLSALILCGSIVTTLAAIQERSYVLRGYVDATKDSNLPFHIPVLGVNAELTQYAANQLEENLGLMEKAHITWVRQYIRWSTIEPTQHHFDWAQTDRLFAALGAHPCLKPVVVLLDTPSWARPAGTSSATPPTNTVDFADFVSAFALRYGTDVDYYQIWDEPNLMDAWGRQEPRAAAYTALLAGAYQTIHTADPEAMVIAAALAPTIETGPKNISDIVFLHDMYAAGAKDYMDAVAAKPYGFDNAPDDRTVLPDTLNFSRIIALREEMVRNGDAEKALWASDWGWNSLPDDWAGKPSIWGGVSSDQQVTYTLAALNRAEREWSWIGGMILNQWQPIASKSDPVWGFSLIDQNSQPTQLLKALVDRPNSKQAKDGLYPAVNSFTHYSGVWTFGALGADIGWVQDSQFTLDFEGSDVAILLRQDNYTAYLYPTVDGHPTNAVPRDASGNSYIVLTSPSLLPETNLIPVARGLPVEPHELHIVADRGWDRWAIAGFGISSGDLSQPFDRQIAVGWLTTLLAAVSFLTAARQPMKLFIQQLFSFIGVYLNATTQFILSIFSSVALLIGMVLTWGDGVTGIYRHEPVSLLLAIATSGLIKLQPGFLLTIVASVVLFIIIYHNLYIGLTLTIFWAPFFLFPVKLYIYAFPLVEILILLTTCAWILRTTIDYARWRQTSNSQFPLKVFATSRHSLSVMDYLLAIWVMLGLIALIWSPRKDEAFTELRTIFIEPFLFYTIFRTSKLSKEQILYIVDAFLIAGLAVALIGLFQYVQGEAIITAEGGSRRLASVYGSPNNVALFLGRCIPFALAFVLGNLNNRRRIFYLCALVPMGFALLLTQSVGGLFIGVPLSVAAVCWLSLRGRARLVLLGFVTIVIIGFFFSLQSERFARVLDFSSGTNFYRVRAWLSATNVIGDHPITGLGLDQFLYEFRGKYILPDAWQEPNLSHPHNIILDFWVRLGLAGMILLIGLQAVFWKKVAALYRHSQKQDRLYLPLIIGLIGSMVNLNAHGMIDNSIFVIDLSYVFVLLMALTHITNVRSIDEPLI